MICATPKACRWPAPVVRAFSLIEALVASTLLGVVVLAVISAVTTSQQMAFEGEKQLLAAMAADDLMAELVVLPYEDLRARNGLVQPVGSMETLAGAPYPSPHWALGREATVTEVMITEPDLGVQVRGLRVVVAARDGFRVLATVESFVPEPAS